MKTRAPLAECYPISSRAGRRSVCRGGLAAVAIAALVFCFGPAPAQATPILVALAGNAAPAGGNYGGVFTPVLNGSGQVAFLAILSGGSSGQGMFAGLPGSLQAVALLGDAAPAGGSYIAFGSPVLNGAGQVELQASMAGGATGVFAGAPGSLQTAALVGSAAPAGGNFNGFLTIPVLNGAGQVAFRATLSGGSSPQGIFVGVPGSLQAAAFSGDAAPAGGNYASLSNAPMLNDSGQVAFSSTLTGGTSINGIFVGAPGSIQSAALQGSAAPAGGNYSDLETLTQPLTGLLKNHVFW